ncbi:sugar ABC transporter ATP-binding protein [Bacillus canaveralius]|uniref:Sugar ABC transporter ATP-binding protein n=1 Tax=Bacillus canaveralius TaxID=1403243 RepID=A0A2N5GI00_9BACI|nr:sugar ABC transporter ATP-binding protein [Bacillus canaveralius]PLR80547.1 sugar ABC transporter ATP-binding protein [Bacillus canaveralius]PLR92495.1 sugar ABC transporter ATP-binding protein [Bacillus canaveralius]
MEIKMTEIYKSFGNVQVLKNAGIHVKEKEIHALMGENGAGKSTLMKILTGVYIKDAGNVEINGEIQEFKNIKDSENMKIAFIHQELNVLNEMSIVDNMFLGKEIKNRLGLVDKKSMVKLAKEKLLLLGLDIDPNTLIKDISIGKRQLVEIAKALLMDAELIIMDEPTAALTDKEIDLLFNIIKSLKDKGVSFVYISHRMEEIFDLCDEITVMRDGAFVAQKKTTDTSFEEIVSLMVGYDLDDRFPRVEVEAGEVILSVKGLTKKGKFENIDFELRKGEILGFSGLMGSGRTDVMHAIFGSTPFDSGSIYINQKEVKIKSPIDAKKLGIGFITEDRKNEGLILNFTVAENAVLPSLSSFTENRLVKEGKISGIVDEYIKKLRVRTPGQTIEVGKLSGGNQQKIVLAKWLITNPQILILDEPTRGVDVGAKKEIYDIINQLKLAGVAIIVVSSELPEIIGVCDRVAVMHEKKLKKIFDIKEATQEKIMEYSTGGGI